MSENKRHKDEFDKLDREPVGERDFDEAMNLMLGPKTSVKSENREPTKAELERRFKLRRID